MNHDMEDIVALNERMLNHIDPSYTAEHSRLKVFL